MLLPPHITKLLDQRVEAGAAHLDAVAPGWEHLINLTQLDVASPARCVIAQLVGSFDPESLGIVPLHRALELGFDFTSTNSSMVSAGYAYLSEVWRTLIGERRSLGISSQDWADVHQPLEFLEGLVSQG